MDEVLARTGAAKRVATSLGKPSAVASSTIVATREVEVPEGRDGTGGPFPVSAGPVILVAFVAGPPAVPTTPGTMAVPASSEPLE